MGLSQTTNFSYPIIPNALVPERPHTQKGNAGSPYRSNSRVAGDKPL